MENRYVAMRTILLTALLLAGAGVASATDDSVVVEKNADIGGNLDACSEDRVVITQAALRLTDEPTVCHPNADWKARKRRRTLAANSKAQKGARVPKSHKRNGEYPIRKNLLNRPAAMSVAGIQPESGMNAEQVIEVTGLGDWHCEKTTQYARTGEVLTLYNQTSEGQFEAVEIPQYEEVVNTKGNLQRLTRRSDTRVQFGPVGDNYTVLQHSDAIRMVHDVVDALELDWEYVGTVDNGRKMHAALLMPDDAAFALPDFNDGQEKLQQYIGITNQHDGKGAFSFSQFVMRIWCWNQFVATLGAVGNKGKSANADVSFRKTFRHNQHMEANIAKWSQVMALTTQHNRAYIELVEELLDVPMDMSERINFYVNHLGLKGHQKRVEADGTNPYGLSTKGQIKLDTLLDLETQEQNQVGRMDGTVWQAVQVLLDYYDHEYLYDKQGDVSLARAKDSLQGRVAKRKVLIQKCGLMSIQDESAWKEQVSFHAHLVEKDDDPEDDPEAEENALLDAALELA